MPFVYVCLGVLLAAAFLFLRYDYLSGFTPFN